MKATDGTHWFKQTTWEEDELPHCPSQWKIKDLLSLCRTRKTQNRQCRGLYVLGYRLCANNCSNNHSRQRAAALTLQQAKQRQAVLIGL